MKILELTTSATIVSFLLISYFGARAFCAVSPQAYVNGINGFSINRPNGWTVDESGAYGTVVIFYGPLVLETGGKININIVAGTATSSLDEYVSYVKQFGALNFTNFNVVSEGHRNVGGLDCYELVVMWTSMPYANSTHTFNVEQKCVLFVEKGKAYNLVFTASPANYDEYLPAFEESIQTFKLLGPEFPWQTILTIVMGAIVGVGSGVMLVRDIKRRKSKDTTTNNCTSNTRVSARTEFNRNFGRRITHVYG